VHPPPDLLRDPRLLGHEGFSVMTCLPARAAEMI